MTGGVEEAEVTKGLKLTVVAEPSELVPRSKNTKALTLPASWGEVAPPASGTIWKISKVSVMPVALS